MDSELEVRLDEVDAMSHNLMESMMKSREQKMDDLDYLLSLELRNRLHLN